VTRVSIVVPVYNALEYARACIDSIYESRTAVAFEVVLVDNGSESAVGVWAEEQQRSEPNFRYLRYDRPLGFAGAMNAGAAVAQGEFLLLLNSDTLVTDGWLDKLASVLADDPELGLVGPVTNRCGHEIQQDAAARNLFPEEAQAYAARIANRHAIVMEPQRLVFFCTMIRRNLWETLHGLDEIFGTGNFEDDDFCLRARLASYRMAVTMNAFVFHNEGKTFGANRIDHGEMLAKNRSIFGERVARWSKTPRMEAASNDSEGRSISVIVSVTADRAGGLRDTLSSLSTQTLQGFETIVVCPAGLDITAELAEFGSVLKLTYLAVAEEGPAALLNAALDAAKGEWIGYLPAADIFYPFHLEVLASALLREGFQSAHTAWSVVVTERREVIEFFEARPDVDLGDWAPLLCWMHHRDAVASIRLEPSLGVFSYWEFVIQLARQSRPLYLCRVTCERTPDRISDSDAGDVESIMAAHPVDNAAKETQRRHFSDAVRLGAWEDRLIVSRNEKVRRARKLMQTRSASAPGYADLQRRLIAATNVVASPKSEDSRTDIFLFSIIEWSALTQRPHHFAEGLVSRGHRIFWIDVRLKPAAQINADNLVSELKPGLFHVQLAGGGDAIYGMKWTTEILNAAVACFSYLRSAYGVRSAFQLVNFPRWEPLTSALTQAFGWQVAYDCLDNQKAFAELFGHPHDDSELTLMKTSAKVFTSGTVLHEAKCAIRPDTILIPNGVDYQNFGRAISAGLLDHLPRPIVGFFGAFAEWLDFDWIESAARQFPSWSFVYIGCESFSTAAGRARWKMIAGTSNIYVIDQVTPDVLQHYLAQFDVCVMPFKNVAITRSMNAVKLYEYLAAGKPVLAPDLPETRILRDAGLIETYDAQEASFALLKQLVLSGMNAKDVAARKQFAAENTWRDRVDALCAALGL
jgi:GT2 family glycosyltransferase/glycosyltransferase involved in cell wall biosynthesis